MYQRGAWKRFILCNDERQLRKMRQRLFVNLEETFEYLIGLIAAAREVSDNSTSPGGRTSSAPYRRVQQLLDRLRRSFRGLPAERAAEVLEYPTDVGSIETMAFAFCGSPRWATEEGAIAFSHLLDLFDLNFGRPEMSNRQASIAIFTASLVGLNHQTGGTCTWENALRFMHTNADINLLYRFVDMFASMTVINFQPIRLSRWNVGQEVWDPQAEGGRFFLPIPDSLFEWFEAALKEVLDRIDAENERITPLLRSLEDDFEAYRAAYEALWLDMILRPRHALRPDGLDSIRIEIPELCFLGYERLQLFPGPDFPGCRAQYHFARRGNPRALELTLVPSDLNQINVGGMPEEDPRVLTDRLLAFLAVRCLWHIVMGSEPGQRNGRGGSGGGDAVVRPHMRRLPAGACISGEARARALAEFQTTPLPGFTFVRGYTRGATPQSGEPIFGVDGEALQLANP